MNKASKFLVPILTAVLVPSLCQANAIFTLGNNPQPGEENVLLNNGTTGTTVQGTTNQSGTLVNFISTQTLSEPSSGQARIEATSGGSQVGLTNVSFSLANATFADAIFNMFVGGTVGVAGGIATISALTNDGLFTFPVTLGNGENFLTITTSGGEVLNSIGIFYNNSGGFTDLRQVRISGAAGGGIVGNVPDSGTTLALLGGALVALVIFQRRLVQA